MKCVKCGAELRTNQKVCIQCGTRTAAGGNFQVEEDVAWRPSRNMIYAASAVVLLIIIALVARGLKTVPPEAVTKQWFDAMLQREYNKAASFHSLAFTANMQSGITDTRALSDSFIDEVTASQATYTIGKPSFDIPTAPTQAKVTIRIKSPEDPVKEIEVDFTKSGRRWLINNVVH